MQEAKKQGFDVAGLRRSRAWAGAKEAKGAKGSFDNL